LRRNGQNGIIERAVADWLTRANERNYQLPFAQVLMSKGYTVLQISTHGPLEQGKDIIARDRKGRLHAYQMKCGDINLPEWRKIRGEIFDLISIPICNPAVSKTAPYTSYLVTNGRITEEVRRNIDDMNEDNKRRKLGRSFLKIIEMDELMTLFIDAERQLWPSELADTREFLNLLASDGAGLFPRESFCQFLKTWMFQGKTSASTAKSLISASVVLVAQLAQPFESSQNWFAVFECWTCTSSSILRLAAEGGLGTPKWQQSFDLAMTGARDALRNLKKECLSRSDMLEGSRIGDGGYLYRARAVMVLGALSGLELSEVDLEQQQKCDQAFKEWVVGNIEHLWYWGESAFPYYLSIIRYLEAIGEDARAREILETILRRTTAWNEPDSPGGIPDPYVPVSDVLSNVLNVQDDLIDLRKFTGLAYTLEAIVQMMARRDWRYLLEKTWPAISRVQFAEIVLDDPADCFSWEVKEGVHRSPLPNATQSYGELQSQSRSTAGSELPYPAMARCLLPFWLMVCPQRVSSRLVAIIDSASPAEQTHVS
jgi:hypothetical protein